jgi:hypothetical protein
MKDRRSTLCQVLPDQPDTTLCEVCEHRPAIQSVWLDEVTMPYGLCGGCSDDARSIFAAFGAPVLVEPILTYPGGIGLTTDTVVKQDWRAVQYTGCAHPYVETRRVSLFDLDTLRPSGAAVMCDRCALVIGYEPAVG